MSKRNFHVVPKGGGWQVKQEGTKAPVSNHRSQGAATDAARTQARQHQGELIIHRRNGQIRDKDSFGNDSFPPKG